MPYPVTYAQENQPLYQVEFLAFASLPKQQNDEPLDTLGQVLQPEPLPIDNAITLQPATLKPLSPFDAMDTDPGHLFCSNKRFSLNSNKETLENIMARNKELEENNQNLQLTNLKLKEKITTLIVTQEEADEISWEHFFEAFERLEKPKNHFPTWFISFCINKLQDYILKKIESIRKKDSKDIDIK